MARLPDFYRQMLDRKWLGDKTKGGFYKRSKENKEESLALGLEYHPVRKAKFPALDMAKKSSPGARLRMLLGLDGGPQKGDKAGAFLWSTLSDLWNSRLTAFRKFLTLFVEIDRAMRLGGWSF